jgi:hypothetical protein
MTETLAQIRAPHFVAGVVLVDDVVCETAPIVHYMRHWKGERVWDYCRKKNWTVAIVRQKSEVAS